MREVMSRALDHVATQDLPDDTRHAMHAVDNERGAAYQAGGPTEEF